MKLEITLPTSWSELTDEQLELFFELISQDLSAPEVKTMLLLRFNNIRVITKAPNGWWVKHCKQLFTVPTSTFVTAISTLDFLDHVPDRPVRLSKIGKHAALDATFSGVPFDTYLYAENLYQGYLHTQDMGLLEQLVQTLYQSTSIKAEKHHCLMVFYWFSSLKILFSKEFKHFFQPFGDMSSGDMLNEKSLYETLRDAMNGQIRVLTNGDITKEKEVLEMDTWRALTELDAKAYDYDQLNKKS